MISYIVAKIITPFFWLTVNTYFEARNQPPIGKVYVAHVVLNRMVTRKLSIKGVILQSNQFSWTRKDDNQKKTIKDFKAFLLCAETSLIALKEHYIDHYTANNIQYYFNPNVANPNWAKNFNLVDTIKDHEFYSN